jgi:hypothetical protein
MTYRLSAARVRADYAALGTVAAVARKHGVTPDVIQRRAPELKGTRGRYGSKDFGLNDPLRRAAFLFSIGMTLDEAASAAGVSVTAAVTAIQARHACRQEAVSTAVRAIAAHAGR